MKEQAFSFIFYSFECVFKSANNNRYNQDKEGTLQTLIFSVIPSFSRKGVFLYAKNALKCPIIDFYFLVIENYPKIISEAKTSY